MDSEDYGSLPARERGLVEYAVRLTAAPDEVSESDIHILRSSGLDDEAILHAAQIIAYFNFVNRLAQGLGVQLES